MAIGIVDSPIKMVIFHHYVNVYQSAKKNATLQIKSTSSHTFAHNEAAKTIKRGVSSAHEDQVYTRIKIKMRQNLRFQCCLMLFWETNQATFRDLEWIQENFSRI
jgi:hypothetical protein